MRSIQKAKIQEIAVIGGGPSGICTAKYLLAEKTFSKIQIFEQSGTVQGAWKHTTVDDGERIDIPQRNPYQSLSRSKRATSQDKGPVFTTPMYDRLETNIPHQLMGFADRLFPNDSPLYPSREVVSTYLEEYAREVRHLIKFHTQVQDVHFVGSEQKDSWKVTFTDLCTGDTSSEIFDAVVVCSGHYDLPYIPDVPGISQWDQAYPKTISHSKLYRSPDRFSGKKVIIVGNSASGMDIANQIAEVSFQPLLISQRSSSWLNGSNSVSEANRLSMLPQIVEYMEPTKYDRAVKFTNGRVEYGIDLILYCTGYLYSFPFLSSFQKEIIQDGTRVHGIYQFLFFMRNPSLAFVGLPIRVVPFPLAEVQAAVIAKVWSDQLRLPSMEIMKRWEDETVKENGEGKKFLNLDDLRDFRYHNSLYDWASKVGFADQRVPKRWSDRDFWLRSRLPAIKKAYTHMGDDKYSIKTPEELDFSYEENVD